MDEEDEPIATEVPNRHLGWTDYQLALALFCEQKQHFLLLSLLMNAILAHALTVHRIMFFLVSNKFHVDLSYNELTSVGAMLYCEAVSELKLPLQHLDLSHNRIGDNVIPILIRFFQYLAGQYLPRDEDDGILMTKRTRNFGYQSIYVV